MAIDIVNLRAEKGGNIEAVRDSEKRRGRSGSLVDKVIALDENWRKCQYEQEQAKREANAAAKEVGAAKKADPKADVSALVAKSAEAKKRIPELEAEAGRLLAERDNLLAHIGNFVHESVVVSNDEENNEVLRTWGTVSEDLKCDGTPGKLPHYEIIAKLNGVEMKKGGEIAGHRGYYLTGYGAMLNQALYQYGQAFLRRKGYTSVQPPFFMKRDWMAKTAELKEFGETLYKIPASDAAAEVVDAKKADDAKREDMFLIATSEQPLCALHSNEYLDKELPLKYAGMSTCFRKEAGSHGKDMRGIFRIHQFEKVEQFIICDPKDSWAMHDAMIKCSEEFYQSLNVPYRIVSIVTGALNDAAARKYDLEAWFPSYEAYRELVSCSNCTDYQARDLNIRHGAPKMGEREKPFVHMLNGTLTACQRTMCCLLEHYQTADGVRVPRVLQPYMDGLTFLPYPRK